MALRLANPSPDWRIVDIQRYLRYEGSLSGGQAAPTQGEFRGDQADAEVGSTPGTARGVPRA